MKISRACGAQGYYLSKSTLKRVETAKWSLMTSFEKIFPIFERMKAQKASIFLVILHREKKLAGSAASCNG